MLISRKPIIILLSIIFSFVIVPVYAAAAVVGNVILLHGTSSAGKSSIAGELCKAFATKGMSSVVLSTDTLFHEIYRDKIRELGYEVDSKKSITDLYESLPENIGPTVRDIVPLVGKALDKAVSDNVASGKNVIVDVVIDDLEAVSQWAERLKGVSALFVLVYCSPHKLVEHVRQRNMGPDRDEHRPSGLPFGQFFSMYTIQQGKSGEPIDVMSSRELGALIDANIVPAATSDDGDEDDKGEARCALKVYHEKFVPCSDKDMITIVPESFIPHDLIVNSGTSSPAECAHQIIEKHSTRKA